MEKKEPYASQQEFNKRVVHYRDIPPIDLFPGLTSHIVSAEKITVSLVTAEPDSQGAIHHHEEEQIIIITDGECDLIFDGKLYHLEEGDVLVVPPSIEHGIYVSQRGCHIIAIFSPPRRDLVAKLEAMKKG